ncbi:MAG: glycoside hydrolase family 95 protein, partial [Clostridia bacterium]|nr:glycoside hydrolase family 95 protein [Clostridia bacterium]
MNDKLWYLSPAAAWEEALPIGNGKQGAMIYGGACRERISLNEDTLWSGTPKDKNNQGAAQYLPEIRKLMESGDVVGAEEIINRHTLGEMSETYLPFCDMEITTRDAAVTDYRRELDIKNGIFRMTCLKDGKAYSETAFASYPDGLIVIKIRSERPEDLNLSLSSKLKCTVEPTKNGAVIYGVAPESNLPTV